MVQKLGISGPVVEMHKVNGSNFFFMVECEIRKFNAVIGFGPECTFSFFALWLQGKTEFSGSKKVSVHDIYAHIFHPS